MLEYLTSQPIVPLKDRRVVQVSACNDFFKLINGGLYWCYDDDYRKSQTHHKAFPTPLLVALCTDKNLLYALGVDGQQYFCTYRCIPLTEPYSLEHYFTVKRDEV